MRYPTLAALFDSKAAQLAKGPLSIVMAEDEVEIASTIAHQLKCGFRHVILLAPEGIGLPPDHDERIHIVTHEVFAEAALPNAVNEMMDRVAGAWVHYCYNTEYLFFPFCETRRIGEMLTFHAEERREAMLTYVIDLYAGDLTAQPDAVSLGDAWLDKSGYYALTRKDPARNWQPKERQMDFFGGLRWRFEEHVPRTRRRIDRISLFRARAGLRLSPDFTLNDEEMNTYSCPWHHNLTAAVCSFRAAKALRANPGSRDAIQTFRWRNSVPFEWHSQQLMDLGLMEPGQWF
ncbi:MAG: hypothetical protein ACK4P8_03165 [Tabrizicola sp.]